MPAEHTRLDKWLWAARFHKTRSAATEAVVGGKVDVNGETAKPARAVHPGDTIRVRVAPYEHTVVVTAIADRRGSAAVAPTLYRETEASRLARERHHHMLKIAPGFDSAAGKPSKRDRRAMDKFRGKR